MNKFTEILIWFAFGAAVAVVLCAWSVGGGPVFEAKRQNDKLIAACEQSLPRNQHCVLVAVVKESEK